MCRQPSRGTPRSSSGAIVDGHVVISIINSININSTFVVHVVFTGDHSKQDQMLLVKIAKYIGFCLYRRSYFLWSPVIVQLQFTPKVSSVLLYFRVRASRICWCRVPDSTAILLALLAPQSHMLRVKLSNYK